MDPPDTDSAAVPQFCDVIVVGGGPAGLSAALVLSRSCRSVLVIDAGRPRNAAARVLHGYLGLPDGPPSALLELGRAQVRSHGGAIIHDTVVQVDCVDEHDGRRVFRVATRSGAIARSRKLLLAIGVVDEIPDLKGIDACYGITAHHCPYCDGWEHRGKRLLAYGKTARSAAGLGLMLRSWSDQVVVLSNGAALESARKAQLKANGVAWREEKIQELVEVAGELRGVRFDSGEELPADALFFSTGHAVSSPLPEMLGCEFKEGHFVSTRHKQRTSVPGVFLAGDADADAQFAIVAAAEGAIAATAIHRELQDEDRVTVA